MKRILILLALVASAAACASEKKQADASENTESTATKTTANTTASVETTSPTTVETHDGDDKVILARKNDDGSEMTFEQVLDQYKGKVVYVDFWASWCGPCRAEMPSSKKLHSELKGKEVVFLYVSLDKQEDAWKNGIKQMDIKGIHYSPLQNAAQAVYTKYEVYGIPRYMLVNKEGKVVNADAPRPSSGEAIKSMITELL